MVALSDCVSAVTQYTTYVDSTGVTCPRCGEKHVTRLSTRRKWQCKGCRYQFSVTAGTIFHKTYVDLPRWLMAVWLMCHSPKGISSKQIQRELGVTYKTAWYMTTRIRKAMRHHFFGKRLGGIVEVDTAVVKATGGKATGKNRKHLKDVMGMAERGGMLRLVTVKRMNGANIAHIAASNLGQVRALYTDGGKEFETWGKQYDHHTVTHLREYVRGPVHVNAVENAWSLFKRGLTGVYHVLSAKYLQDYLDEFAFRYSHRDHKERLMGLVLASC